MSSDQSPSSFPEEISREMQLALERISPLGLPFGLNHFVIPVTKFEPGPHTAKNACSLARNHLPQAREHSWECGKAEKKAKFSERLFALRANTGLTKDSLRKLRLEEEPLDPHRMAHYRKLCSVSVESANQTRWELVDVDGKYDPIWPSKSDYTLLLRGHGEEPHRVLLVDIHSGPYRHDKLQALAAQAIQTLAFEHAEVCVATLRVAMDETPWLRSDPVRCSLDRELHFSLAVPGVIGEMILNSREEQNQRLVDSLHSTVGEAVRESILDEYQKALEEDSYRDQSRALLAEVEARTSVKREDLLDLCRHRGSGIYLAIKELAELGRHLKLPKVVEMLELPGSGVWLDPDQCEMRCAPPIPVADLEERRNVVNQMLNHDPLMRGIHRVLGLEGLERVRSASGLAIGLHGEVIPIPLGEEPQFDIRQTTQTKFHPKVLAYVRRPRSTRTSYRRRVDGVVFPRSEMSKEDLSLAPKLFNVIFEVMETYVYAPNMQVLINFALYDDPRLTKFLRRGYSRDQDPLERSKEEERFEILKANEERFQRYVDSCIPEPNSAIQMRASRGSATGKMSLLLSRVAAASVRNVFSLTRGLMENYLGSYYDYESQKARSMAITMSGRTPENLMTLIEVPSYAAVVLTYVNNEALHFRTTWCKEIVLTSASNELLQFCDSGKIFDPQSVDLNGMPQQVSFISVEVKAGQLGFPAAQELRIMSSKFHSRNRMDLDWAVERPYKCMVRMASLVEMRGLVYSQSGATFEWDNPSTYAGIEFARRELVINLSGFGEQSQQNSISQTAERYLHQSLGSLDNDPMATLKKLDGIRLRGCSRVASHGMMASVYVLGTILRFAGGPESLSSGNGEVAVLMPDLLRASSLAQLNVSCYATPNQMIVDKPNATASEALDVQGVWDNNAKVRKVERDWPHLRHGISEDLATELLSAHAGGMVNNSEDLALWVQENSQRVCANVRHIATLKRGTQLVNCVFFEVLAHLRLRLEVACMDSISHLSGQSLADFFTTKGSFRSKEFESNVGTVHTVESLRKAAAVSRVLAEMKGFSNPKTQQMLLAKSLDSRADCMMDLYQVPLAVETGLLISLPLGKGSDKDAPGKNREITTLEAVFGMECVALERMHFNLSKAIPEDQIKAKDKESALVGRLNKAQLAKRLEDDTRTYYINRDMSAHGPTHKSCSSAVTVSVLAADKRSLDFGLKVVAQSLKKKWLYPDNIVNQALELERAYNPATHASEWRAPDVEENDRNQGPSRTAQVMREMSEQYYKGSLNGPVGSTWAEVADGMPGQGIFSIQASVSHSSIARLAKRELGEVLGWGLETLVNSDDSMVILTIPKEKTEDVRRALRPVLSRFIMFAGLCENEGKFTPTIRRPEFVSLFHSGSEPIAQVFKYTNALTAMDTGANLAEDLHRASTRGADVMKHGTSFYIASVVSAACMSLAIDAHRAWGLYGDALQTGSPHGEMGLMDLLPEEMGLPRIDPASSVISSLGSRLASYANLTEQGPMDEKYVRYLVGSLFSTPETLVDSLATDLRAGRELRRHTALLNADGSLDAVIPRRLQIPNVNGVSGILRRPKGTLRLARQLGPQLSLVRGYLSDYQGKLHLGDLLGSAMRGLRNPLEHGEDSPSVIVQVNDLNHSAAFKNLRISPKSALSVLFEDARVSQSDLFKVLKKPESARRIREKFLQILDLEDEVPVSLRSLYESLVTQGLEVLALARDLKVAHLEPNFGAMGLLEHEYGHYRARKIVKRTFDVRAGSTITLNRDEAFRVFLSESVRPQDKDRLPLYLERLLDGTPLRGSEELLDGLEQAEVMADRLLGALPHSYKVTAFVSAFAREGDRMIEEWVRHNVIFGHRAVWPNGDVRSRSLSTILAMPRTIQQLDALSAMVKNHATEVLSRDLEGRRDEPARPVGVRTAVASSLLDLVLGGPPGVISQVLARSALRTNADLLSATQAHFSLSREEISSNLIKSSRFGWVAGGGRAYRVFGPVAWWGSHRTQRSQAYVCQSREWNALGTSWTHVLVWAGDSPQSLSEVQWMDFGNRDYLKTIKDGLVLGRAGLETSIRTTENRSGISQSGRPLTSKDVYSQRVLSAQNSFQVIRRGYHLSLRLLGGALPVEMPFARSVVAGDPRELHPTADRSAAKLQCSTLSLELGPRQFVTAGMPHFFAGEDVHRCCARFVSASRKPGMGHMLLELQSVSSHLLESLGERTGPDLSGVNLPSLASLKDVEPALIERDWDVVVESVAQMTRHLQLTYERRKELARRVVTANSAGSNAKILFGALVFMALDRLSLGDPASARSSLLAAPISVSTQPRPEHAPPPPSSGNWADDDEEYRRWEDDQEAFERAEDLSELHRTEAIEEARTRGRGRVFDLMSETFNASMQERLAVWGRRVSSRALSSSNLQSDSETRQQNLSDETDDAFLQDLWASWHASKARVRAAAPQVEE